MSADDLAALKGHFEKFVVTETGRPLGAAGTRLALTEGDRRVRVDVHLGYPLDAGRERFVAELERHAAGFDAAPPLEIAVEWSVEAHSVQQGLKPLGEVSNIIAVASGKGGVGKSTVAVNLALGLAHEGARVGILDADIYGPSQPRMLGLVGRKPETRDGKTLEPLVAHGLEAMSIGFLVDEEQPMAWRGPMVTSALNQLLAQTHWGELDYLVVDMPPGTGDIQLTLAQKVPVSGAVIVTTPQDIALADARKGLEMFQKVSVPVLGIIENMSVHICSSCGHEEAVFGSSGGARLGESYGLPVLGQLPLEMAIREETDSGRPTVVADPDGPSGRRFIAAALRAAGELAAQSKDYSRLFPNIKVEGGQ